MTRELPPVQLAENEEQLELFNDQIGLNGILNDLCKSIHNDQVARGWYNDNHRTFGDMIALFHSEISEALEEFRAGRSPTKIYYSGKTDEGYPQTSSTPSKFCKKPEGIPIELADLLIRVFDSCAYYGIDIEAALLEKNAYNKTRPVRHGGKVI